MAKITQPKKVGKPKYKPDNSTRESVKKAIRDQAEAKRYPKPEVEQNKKTYPKGK